MAERITVDRSRWVGFRWQRHGLAGHARKDALDDLLLLGVQAGGPAGTQEALSQRASRIGRTSIARAVSRDGPLVRVWSVRGAPHAHRLAQLDFVRDALAPRESDDGGAEYVAAVDEVAAALRAVVTEPMSKAGASTAVTARVSANLTRWCERCSAKHVPDGLFRASGRQAQLLVGAGEKPGTMLWPKPRGRQEKVAEPALAMLRAYLRVNGPTSRTQYRDWLQCSTQTAADLWAQLGDDLVRVTVEDRRYHVPAALVDDFERAPKADGTALVPPNDPYLRQVDRTLLVPDSRCRAEVYKALSGPGALLVDGEVAGTWRYRRSETTLTVSAFDPLPRSRRADVEERAAALAAATGDDQPTIDWA